MALEIRELVIKVTIAPEASTPHPLANEQALRALREGIIKECMERLLTRIENDEDR